MRPAISSFPNDSFYQGALRDASIVEERPPPLKSQFLLPQLPEALGPSSTVSAPRSTIERDGANSTSSPTVEGEPFPVSFVAHSSPESTYRQSLLNRGESDLLITIVGDLLSANPDLVASDIGIISPYYAQMRLVSNSFASGFASARLGELLGPDRAASVVDVEVNTVDGFQGREKRVVLLSTVRSNRGGWIGFLNDKRRLNVALTRARDALIVVGNEHTLRRAAARAAPLTVPPPPRTSQVLQALREEEDKEGGIFAAAAGDAAADPDADPRIWADFLDWCQERGIVQRLEGPPVPA
jgi:superfamily I DNA and/or RNA helicase